MIKRFTLCLLLLIASAPFSYADPVWGTDMPEPGCWTAGFRNNILFDDKLNDEHGGVSSIQYFSDLSLGITDWLCLDGRLGLGGLRHDADDRYDIDYAASFAGGYGFRVRAFDIEPARIKGVLGFQHICVHPSVEDVPPVEHRAVFDSWQFSAVISKGFKYVVPYIGAALGRGDLIEWIDDQRKRRKGSGPYVGLAIGSDIPLTENLRINIEGRFFDETSFSSGVLWRF